MCGTGYTGDNCETDVDECADSAACNSHGSCTNAVGYFNCSCNGGYSGHFCQFGGSGYELPSSTFVKLILFLAFVAVCFMGGVGIGVYCHCYRKRRLPQWIPWDNAPGAYPRGGVGSRQQSRASRIQSQMSRNSSMAATQSRAPTQQKKPINTGIINL